ncbi:MAG: tetratricopeptide repeat protein [Paludibacter sp.]|nr:tetratricopeptide repeat protein [Paludibacter sp.]
MRFRFQTQTSITFQTLLCSIGKLFLILSFCLVSSCSVVPNELKLAEQIIETKPDSALYILQNLPPNQYRSESNRALYGLLLFQTLDKLDMPLQPDSLIDFSIDYFLRTNKNINLAKAYFFKGRMLRKVQRYDAATQMFLNALDCLNNYEDFYLLGGIYSNLGDIISMQGGNKESLNYFAKSIAYFKRADAGNEACYRIICVGRTYRFLKNYKKAEYFYRQALSQTSDSILKGYVFQEIGTNYYWTKQFDSAQNYLRKSLQYPSRSTNYAIRCFVLADLFFDLNQIDSATLYAQKSLKSPASFSARRDCYRILVNCEYLRKHLELMGKYMTQYQNYTDSVRTLEAQTKATVLENLHDRAQETQGTKRNMIWIVSILMFVLLVVIATVLVLQRRNKHRKNQVDLYKHELTNKQAFVVQNLSNKIQEARGLQKELRKQASAVERERLDRQLYEQSLHIDNWDAFSCEMNHAFNNIVDVLLEKYPSITHKEIIWCCLNLLDIPNSDRILILDATAHSLYKLKQRLAQKLELKSTKDLNDFLKQFTSDIH